MEQQNRQEVNTILRHYKTPEGQANYPVLLSIPRTERIPELAKKDFTKICALITGALTIAFESMNLKRGMNAIQILDLSEAIIDTSSEDNLAFEDLMLFLQKLVRGEYGTTYESMDIPKFMQFFEKYREERWQELNRIKIETHIQHKCNGDTGRSTKNHELSEHFSAIGSRLNEMKDALKSKDEQIKDLKIKNF